MSEITPDRWLYTKLAADNTLAAMIGGSSGSSAARIYSDIAPQGAAFPLVTLIQLSDQPVAGVGPAIIMWSGVYGVKVSGGGAYSAIETIADRVRVVLQAASGSVTGGVVVACTAEGRQRLTEIVDGVLYRTLVLLFRIYSQ